MSKTSIAGVEAAFKILYDKGTMPDTTTDETILLKDTTKTENFRAKQWEFTIKTSNSQGVGKTVADAQAADNDVAYHRYNLTRAKWFATARIDGEAAEAGEDDGSVVDIVEDKVSGVANTLVLDIAIAEYGNGSGVRGEISDVTSNVITFTESSNMNYLDVGMLLEAVADNTTTTTVTSAAPRRVMAINRKLRTVTLNAAFGGTTNAGDFVVRSSMESTSGASVFHGLQSWLNNQGSSTPDIYNMVRTTDPENLAGHLGDYTDQDPNMAVLDFCSIIAARARGGPKSITVNPITCNIMKSSPHSKVYYTGNQSEVHYGLDKLGFRTETGALRMRVDPFAPVGEGFLLNDANFRLHSLRKAPHMKRWGDKFMLVHDDDAIEARWNFYGALPFRKLQDCGRMTGLGE